MAYYRGGQLGGWERGGTGEGGRWEALGSVKPLCRTIWTSYEFQKCQL